ncbi:MAG: hypothetical protein GY842_05700 [bacterium]|nr:hypothetical protein [bacterium]
MQPSDRYVLILRVVEAIPPGHVMTYAAVAEAAGLPRRARLVGKVLADLPAETAIPWHRVINASGRLSQRRDADVTLQRHRLEQEGLPFDATGRLNLDLYAHHPSSPPST